MHVFLRFKPAVLETPTSPRAVKHLRLFIGNRPSSLSQHRVSTALLITDRPDDHRMIRCLRSTHSTALSHAQVQALDRCLPSGSSDGGGTRNTAYLEAKLRLLDSDSSTSQQRSLPSVPNMPPPKGYPDEKADLRAAHAQPTNAGFSRESRDRVQEAREEYRKEKRRLQEDDSACIG